MTHSCVLFMHELMYLRALFVVLFIHICIVLHIFCVNISHIYRTSLDLRLEREDFHRSNVASID